MLLGFAKKSSDFNQVNKKENRPWLHFLSYSSPYITMAWLGAPIHVIQGIYAKYYGFSLTTLASIILLARLFDAITDPLIGYYSDRYARRKGTRKPFILAGGLLLIISAYFLYVPIGDNVVGESRNVSVAYFTIWFMALYLAMTLFEIPHSAWASELALTSADKAKIFSFRSVAGSLGMVFFYLVPMLPFFDSQDITPETLKVSVLCAAVLMLPFLYLCMKKTPSRSSSSVSDLFAQKKITDEKIKKQNYLATLLQSIFTNKPLLIFLAVFLAYGCAVGMWYALVFLYVDSYLGLGAYFAQTFLLAFIVGIVATPAWCKVAIIFGKKAVLSAAMILLIASFLYASLLQPEVSGFNELLVLQILNVVGGGCMVAFAPAMLSEIIDYSALKHRTENTATYYALFMFLGKLNIAIGGAMSLAIAGWYGFDATTRMQTTEGVVGLMMSMVWLPIIFITIALLLIITSPINSHRHGIVRRRLDKRHTAQYQNAAVSKTSPSTVLLDQVGFDSARK